jgi:hypothetical protein
MLAFCDQRFNRYALPPLWNLKLFELIPNVADFWGGSLRNLQQSGRDNKTSESNNSVESSTISHPGREAENKSGSNRDLIYAPC